MLHGVETNKLKAMEININLIGNILIALIIYNLIIKTISFSILKMWVNSKPMEAKKKSFQEKIQELKDKQNQK